MKSGIIPAIDLLLLTEWSEISEASAFRSRRKADAISINCSLFTDDRVSHYGDTAHGVVFVITVDLDLGGDAFLEQLNMADNAHSFAPHVVQSV